MYDVLCYGAICADHRIDLPRFPRPGEGMHIIAERWTPGGNALNEALALARRGRRVVLTGDRPGDDQPGRMVWAGLAGSGVDCSYLQHQAGGRTTVCRILLTPDGERTILAQRDNGAPYDLPPAELLARCRLVSLSRLGPGGALETALMARAAGCLLVVGDPAGPNDPLATLADAIIVSAAELRRRAGDQPIEHILLTLQRAGGAAVLLTEGPGRARVIWGQGGVCCIAVADPPADRPGDSVGAGDRFRAAVAHALLDGLPWPVILGQAVAAATCDSDKGAVQ